MLSMLSPDFTYIETFPTLSQDIILLPALDCDENDEQGATIGAAFLADEDNQKHIKSVALYRRCLSLRGLRTWTRNGTTPIWPTVVRLLQKLKNLETVYIISVENNTLPPLALEVDEWKNDVKELQLLQNDGLLAGGTSPAMRSRVELLYLQTETAGDAAAIPNAGLRIAKRHLLVQGIKP